MSSDDVASLDPQQPTDLASTRIASPILEGLYEFAEYDATYEKLVATSDGPERVALARRMSASSRRRYR